jgi:hypothetical protein
VDDLELIFQLHVTLGPLYKPIQAYSQFVANTLTADKKTGRAIATTYLIPKTCMVTAVHLRPSSLGCDHRFLHLLRNISGFLTRLVVYCYFI